jgi:hypothetical protein
VSHQLSIKTQIRVIEQKKIKMFEERKLRWRLQKKKAELDNYL